MKQVILGLFLLGVWNGYGQEQNPFFTRSSDSTVKQETGVFADYYVGSNAITNSFVNRFFMGGFIDDKLKKQVEGRLQKMNYLGGDINEGLWYSHRIDSGMSKGKFSWFISVRSRQHADFAYSKDLFKVCFEGNDAYKGQTADFNGFQLNTIQYQQFQAGIAGPHFGIALSVYNGSQYQQLHAPTAQLFTSQAGDYLDFTTRYSMTVSDPKSTSPFANNGLGAGLDFYYHAPLYIETKRKGEVFLECSDIGFITWNRKTNHYAGDTMYHFDGFAINNAFQLADTSVHYSAKTILNAHVQSQSYYTSFLPGNMNISYVPDGKIWQFVPGIRLRYAANYKPFEYLQLRYHIRSKITLNIELGYGGYAGLQSALSVQAKLFKGLHLKAGTYNFAGYIIPAFTCGQGAYVSIVKLFH
ncbi:MAG: DUF5723 family protein [Bacteroidia bacterium]